MTKIKKQDLNEWYMLRKQYVNGWHLSESDKQRLLSLNHELMLASHEIHNKNMMGGL